MPTLDDLMWAQQTIPDFDKMPLEELIPRRNDLYRQIKTLERIISLGHGFEDWSEKYEKLCRNRELYEHVRIAVKDYCLREYGSEYFAFKKEARSYYRKYKDQISFTTFLNYTLLEQIGSRCARCNTTDKDVLSFDHIYDDGQPDRDCFNSQSEFYLHYLMNLGIARKRLQVLCRNCNTKKEVQRQRTRS